MDNYRLLLERAARLYDKHEAGRPQPFNIFSVLRSESDEVNLHSRFLHALLDYKKPGKETRENLADFLRHVGVKDFEPRGIKVERERDNIDILITNDAGQAVVVENKIRSGDQPEQLQRYHDALKGQGYAEIHLLYLTPYGNDPSEESAGSLPYEAISYKDTLPPWLERCQQRAYHEPELRESVAQYRQLVQKLTGTDFGRVYMDALTKLCLDDNNLVLVHDLNEAMIEAKVHLLQGLWSEIDAALRAEISDLPSKDDKLSDTSYETVKHFVTAQRNYKRWSGLYYSFSKNAALGIRTDYSLIFGVRCHKKHQNERTQLENALQKNVGSRESSSDDWPWIRWAKGADLNLKYPTRENLELLSRDDGRKKYAEGIARDLKPVWEAIKAAGFGGQDT